MQDTQIFITQKMQISLFRHAKTQNASVTHIKNTSQVIAYFALDNRNVRVLLCYIRIACPVGAYRKPTEVNPNMRAPPARNADPPTQKSVHTFVN